MPAWCYRDPAETVRLAGAGMQMPALATFGDLISHHPQRVRIWDAHYRQARRLHVKQLMMMKMKT